ncbi:MAG: conjugal transfer transcriptional regulator TraJ [Pseudomonas paracarnis]
MSDKDAQQRKRKHHLRVPVFPEEQQRIEEMASQAGRSVAAYLRDVGQSYPIRGVMDYEKVRELAAINGDLGRLGGLLKLWLTNDPKTAHFGESTIRALLARIEKTQYDMTAVMRQVIHPRADR